MEQVAKPIQQKRRREKNLNIYTRCLITRKIMLPIVAIGKNLQENIEENIKSNFEGKCVVEGYIKPGSVKIITYSSGTIERGNHILFEIVFECDICFPVEGMIMSCVAKNITKAGIRAESAGEVPSPIVVFIAKDHHYDASNASHFAEIKEGDKINIRVIGQRFELNDKYISIIGELIKEKEHLQSTKPKNSKPRLVIEEE
jgi:DNA-directed RNA polymerase subunit E'/Rpb7